LTITTLVTNPLFLLPLLIAFPAKETRALLALNWLFHHEIAALAD
jgi:hypothetical protein